jgi:hypothetical protein
VAATSLPPRRTGARRAGAWLARLRAALRVLRPARGAGTMPLSGMVGAMGGVLAAGQARAVDLPQDRADLMFHSYIGGGVVANGPALLVQKSAGDEFSFSGQYYVDSVSNASIDVVTTASPYRETRIETGVGGVYVHRDSLVSVGATRSKEPDYSADSASLDVSQDLLGGMTTLKLGYTRAWDTVGKHGDPTFSKAAEHWQYRLGLTQILTPRWLASLDLEAISDEGYLSSPYRAARVFGAAVPETDPSTRTSRAATVRVGGSVGEAGAVRADFRYFWDTWEIHARTTEVGYAQHLGPRWTLDGSARYYSQNHAVFYSDDFASAETYMSRNRQLSTFNDVGIGLKASYSAYRVPALLDVQVTAAFQRLRFHYDDFTDLRPGANGALYSFNANVMEIFVSATF